MLLRVPVIKREVLVRVWRKGTLKHCCWKCRLVQPLWKTEWKLLKRFKTELPYDPTIPCPEVFIPRK